MSDPNLSYYRSIKKANRELLESVKRKPKPIKAKCMNCTVTSTITDKAKPCPVCALCGSLAWQDAKEVSK